VEDGEADGDESHVLCAVMFWLTREASEALSSKEFFFPGMERLMAMVQIAVTEFASIGEACSEPPRT
jgi:hypothetical protein